eukprot:1190642-Prorocentrum_minimum.AAC.5
MLVWDCIRNSQHQDGRDELDQTGVLNAMENTMRIELWFIRTILSYFGMIGTTIGIGNLQDDVERQAELPGVPAAEERRDSSAGRACGPDPENSRPGAERESARSGASTFACTSSTALPMSLPLTIHLHRLSPYHSHHRTLTSFRSSASQPLPPLDCRHFSERVVIASTTLLNPRLLLDLSHPLVSFFRVSSHQSASLIQYMPGTPQVLEEKPSDAADASAGRAGGGTPSGNSAFPRSNLRNTTQRNEDTATSSQAQPSNDKGTSDAAEGEEGSDDDSNEEEEDDSGRSVAGSVEPDLYVDKLTSGLIHKLIDGSMDWLMG